MSTAYWTTYDDKFSSCRFTVGGIDIQFSVRDVSRERVDGLYATYPSGTFIATAFIQNVKFCDLGASSKLEAQTLILRKVKSLFEDIVCKMPPELNIDT